MSTRDNKKIYIGCWLFCMDIHNTVYRKIALEGNIKLRPSIRRFLDDYGTRRWLYLSLKRNLQVTKKILLDIINLENLRRKWSCGQYLYLVCRTWFSNLYSYDMNQQWLNIYKDAWVENLPIVGFEHEQILLMMDPWRRVDKYPPFCFEG